MRWSPGAEVEVLAGRVADRLRVLGPRLAARQDGQAARDLAVQVGELLRRLAALAADTPAGVQVPVLAPRAWGDQVLVLAAEVAAGADPAACAAAREALEELRRQL